MAFHLVGDYSKLYRATADGTILILDVDRPYEYLNEPVVIDPKTVVQEVSALPFEWTYMYPAWREHDST